MESRGDQMIRDRRHDDRIPHRGHNMAYDMCNVITGGGRTTGVSESTERGVVGCTQITGTQSIVSNI